MIYETGKDTILMILFVSYCISSHRVEDFWSYFDHIKRLNDEIVGQKQLRLYEAAREA